MLPPLSHAISRDVQFWTPKMTRQLRLLLERCQEFLGLGQRPPDLREESSAPSSKRDGDSVHTRLKLAQQSALVTGVELFAGGEERHLDRRIRKFLGAQSIEAGVPKCCAKRIFMNIDDERPPRLETADAPVELPRS